MSRKVKQGNGRQRLVEVASELMKNGITLKSNSGGGNGVFLVGLSHSRLTAMHYGPTPVQLNLEVKESDTAEQIVNRFIATYPSTLMENL